MQFGTANSPFRPIAADRERQLCGRLVKSRAPLMRANMLIVLAGMPSFSPPINNSFEQLYIKDKQCFWLIDMQW